MSANRSYRSTLGRGHSEGCVAQAAPSHKPLDLEAMLKFRKIRESQWERFGPISPVDRKARLCIPRTSWECPRDIDRALKAVCEQFEIIYDPLTRQRWELPERGLHLYSCLRDERYPGWQFLRLEKSLQWDMDEKWPKGNPRKIGWWIVEWAKENDKRHLPFITADRNDLYLADKRIEHHIAKQEEMDNQLVQAAEYIHSDFIDPWWNRKRLLVSNFGKQGNINIRH